METEPSDNHMEMQKQESLIRVTIKFDEVFAVYRDHAKHILHYAIPAPHKPCEVKNVIFLILQVRKLRQEACPPAELDLNPGDNGSGTSLTLPPMVTTMISSCPNYCVLGLAPSLTLSSQWHEQIRNHGPVFQMKRLKCRKIK